MQSGHLVVAILSSHPLALKDTARKRAISNRPTVTKVLVGPVASGKAAHTVPLNDSSIPAPFGTSDDVDQFSWLKDLSDCQFATDFVVIDVSDAEFAQHHNRVNASSFAMANQGLIRALGFACAKAKLERCVPVPLDGLLLHYCARASLDDSDRHERTIHAKNLAHPELFTDETNHILPFTPV